MTNAEKYLKDNVDIKEFVNEYADYYTDETVKRPVVIRDNLRKFLEEQAKTLTEDERVILKYVDGEYTHIQRADGLWLIHYEDEYTVHQLSFGMYSHLFQFIKNGEEYSIEELLNANNE